MEKVENIFRSLGSGCLKILLHIADENTVTSPSQISIDLNINRRKVEHCLNNFMKGGLVVKVQRGLYKISKKGIMLINMLGIVSSGDNVLIWNDNGFYELTTDFLEDLVGDTLSNSQVNKYLIELKKDLFSFGYISVEYLILYLCHLLFRDGYESICSSTSKKIMYIPNPSTMLPRYRKYMEASMIGYITPLLRENILKIDDPHYLEKYYVAFLPKNSFLPFSNPLDSIESTYEMVINTDSINELTSLIKNNLCIINGKHLTVNIHEKNFSADFNDHLRTLLNDINLSLIIHGNADKIVEDELLLHILYNNLKQGIDTLLANDKYYSNMLISHNGFSSNISNKITIVSTVIKLNLKNLIEKNYQETFIESGVPTILRYDDMKLSIINPGENKIDNHIYLLLTGLKDMWSRSKKTVIQFVSSVQRRFDEQAKDIIRIGLEDSVNEEEIDILFIVHIPPLSNIIIDVKDLRYTILKFYKSRYPLLRIYARS